MQEQKQDFFHYPAIHSSIFAGTVITIFMPVGTIRVISN